MPKRGHDLKPVISVSNFHAITRFAYSRAVVVMHGLRAGLSGRQGELGDNH